MGKLMRIFYMYMMVAANRCELCKIYSVKSNSVNKIYNVCLSLTNNQIFSGA